MGALDVQDVSKSIASEVVSLGALAKLTGFPVDYIKRELFNEGEQNIEELPIEDLKKKVLAYLDSNF